MRATSKARKATLLFSVATLLAVGAAAVRGQPVLDDFDPNANGHVLAITVQPDGKILIGGDFTTLAPNGGAAVIRNHIARLNADGTLDAAFDPDANDTVSTIAVQADGKVLAGGNFSGPNSIGGQTRHRIARLDATTGLADPFDPNASATVISITVQPDGRVLVGGDFTSIGGQTRNYIARLDAKSGLADSFDPNANNTVWSIAVQANGKILVGGRFSSEFGAPTIGGQARNRIARLDAATGLADSFDPNASATVHSIATQADGHVLAGGSFTNIGGQMRHHIARLDATTGLANSFNPNANDPVGRIAVQPDAKILLGGDFTTLAPNGAAAVTRNHIARLHPDGTLDTAFDPDANDSVVPIVLQPDGKILVGGFFTSINGQPRNYIARLETTPTQTPTPTPIPVAAQPINLSTRLRVQTGDNVGIGGFIITGSAPKQVLLRGIGPSLGNFGVPDPLADPIMELHGPAGFATITNDNWKNTQQAVIEATGLAPSDDLESAIVVTLNPGAYTAIARGKNSSSGVALVEVYDLNLAASSKLGNISTRAFVGTSTNIVIAGFILGNNDGDESIVLRGIGPSLTAFGVPDALANPTLDLRDSNGTPLVRNDNWQDDQAQATIISAAGLAPPNPLESAIAATLPPGAYTALLWGVNDGTGACLVEVYDRQAP